MPRARRCCWRSRTSSPAWTSARTPTARAAPRRRSRGCPRARSSCPTTTRSQLQASYELDLWGKYRSGFLASQNELAASQYYVQTVRISVAAETANTYFRLRAADASLVVLRDTLRLRTDTVQLQRDRFEGGIIGEYDLRSAEAERSAVVADIARAENAVGQLESAIATLTGRTPAAVFVPVVARGASIESRDRGAGAASGPALRAARAATRHPPGRGAARVLRPARAGSARELLPRDLAHRRLRCPVGGDVEPLLRSRGDMDPGGGIAAADLRPQGHRVAGRARQGTPRGGHRAVRADDPGSLPRRARRARRQPQRARRARGGDRPPQPDRQGATRSRSCATTRDAPRSSR